MKQYNNEVGAQTSGMRKSETITSQRAWWMSLGASYSKTCHS